MYNVTLVLSIHHLNTLDMLVRNGWLVSCILSSVTSMLGFFFHTVMDDLHFLETMKMTSNSTLSQHVEHQSVTARFSCLANLANLFKKIYVAPNLALTRTE